MAKNKKEDYLYWEEDIDLDEILGEYTDYEANSTSKADNSTLQQDISYVCPDCQKEYKSISGFRGHVMKKHNKSIKAADYRKGNIEKKEFSKNKKQVHAKENTKKETETFSIDSIFHTAYNRCLSNIQTNPLYNLFGVSSEAKIAKSCDGITEVENSFKSLLSQCFNENCASSVTERELLFKKIHTARTDRTVVRNLTETIQTGNEKLKSFSATDVNNFIQLLILDIVGELFKERIKLEQKKSENSQEEITESDNKVLYYISGYIIRALEKKYSKIKNKMKREEKMEKVQLLYCKTSEKTFTAKFTTWFDRKDRGGLRKPSDDLFLLIREFESVVRKNIDSENLASASLLKADLKEKVLDSFMVKHYENKLFPVTDEEEDSDSSEHFTYIEDALQLFLTVRGFSVAKLIQKKLKLAQKDERKTKSSASLRDALKCISNKTVNQ